MKTFLILLPLLAACAAPKAATETAASKPIGTPNPAAVYCTEQGGKVEIRKGPGGETGYCHLPGGRVVEEWELFRAQHPG